MESTNPMATGVTLLRSLSLHITDVNGIYCCLIGVESRGSNGDYVHDKTIGKWSESDSLMDRTLLFSIEKFDKHAMPADFLHDS